MGNQDLSRTFTVMNETVKLLNDEINKMDWGKRWQTEYPETDRSKLETKNLKETGTHDTFKEFFSRDSLILKNLSEAT